MSAASLDTNARTTISSATSTGPKTPEGKAVAARNATTHGLFCRQTVLPHLGEDPEAYQSLLDHLNEQLRPRNLMERQYIELWLDASWKLRRLSRFEAQIWENDSLDEDARLTKLERLARLQNSLRRQMDKSVRMLGHDLHHLFAQRTREDVLHKMEITEAQVQELAFRRKEVEKTVQANSYWLPVEGRLTGTLDAAPAPPISSLPSPCSEGEPEGVLAPCSEGEPEEVLAPCSEEVLAPCSEGEPEEVPSTQESLAPAHENVQNKLPARPRLSPALPPVPIHYERERLQRCEDMLNNPKIPIQDRCDIARDLGPERIVFEENGMRVKA